jgi:hypothetical protein
VEAKTRQEETTKKKEENNWKLDLRKYTSEADSFGYHHKIEWDRKRKQRTTTPKQGGTWETYRYPI